MFRTLFQLLLLLVVGLIGYNYFYGTDAEQAQSRELVTKVKDLGSDAWNLLRSEREKARAGKYDESLGKLRDLYSELKEQAGEVKDSDILTRLSDLDRRREILESDLGGSDELSRTEQRKLDDLTNDTEALMHEMEAKSQPPAPY